MKPKSHSKTVVAALTLLLLTLQTTIPYSSAAPSDILFVDAVWGSVPNPIEVAPGDRDVVLSIILTNVGRQAVEGVTGTLHLPPGFTNSTTEESSIAISTYPDSVAPGRSFTLTFLLNLAYSVRITTYYTQLDVKYTLESGEEKECSVNVRFRVTGRSVISASIDKSVLTPGSNNHITLYIWNEGTALASQLDITLTLPSGAATPLTYVEGDGHWVVDRLGVGGKAALHTTIYVSMAAANQVYQLPLTITYRDSYGNVKSVVRSLGVRVDKPEAEKITIEASLADSVLTPGSNNQLNILIHNSGEVRAERVEVTLTLPEVPQFAFVEGDGHWTIPTLPPSYTERLTATIYIGVAAANQVYQLPLTVKYEDSYGNVKSVVRVLGVRVGAYEAEKIAIQAQLLHQTLTPGVENKLTLVLRNNGSEAAYGLEATLTLPSGAATLPFAFADTDGHWTIPTLLPKGEVRLKFTLYVSMAAANTVHQLPLTITYRDGYGNPQSVVRSLGVRVVSVETQKVSFEAYLEDTVLSPGSSNNLTLTVRNRGREAAHSLEITLTLPSGAMAPPFALVGSDGHWSVARLDPSEELRLRFGLFASPSAANQAYQLQLTISYHDEEGNPQSVVKTLGVTVAPTTAIAGVEVSAEGFLTAGLLNTLNITITNKSPNPLANLTVTVASESPSITLVGVKRWHFTNIPPGGVEVLSTPVYADPSAAGDAVSLLCTMQYVGEGGVIRTETERVGVYVQGLIKISTYGVSFTRIGGSPTVVGNVLNEGNVEALFTKVSLQTPPGSPFRAGESIYLGDLDPDAPLPFSIPLIMLDSEVEGEYPITITIHYKDALRREHVVKLNMTINVTPPPKVGEKPARFTLLPTTLLPADLQIAGLVAVVVAVAAYAALRKRRRREEEVV